MFESIGKWISEHITEPLQNMIIDSVNAVLIKLLNDAVDMVTGIFGRELDTINQLLSNTYIQQAVTYSVTMAATLLVARIAFEALRTYMLHSSGQESHPGVLLKDAAIACAMIATSPWIAKQVLTFALSIVDDVMGFQAVPNVESIRQAVVAVALGTSGVVTSGMVLLMLIGFVMALILYIQIAVRTVTIGMLMIIGPWMWAFQNELGGSWLKALLGQCFAIPIQMFLLRGAFGSFASIVSAAPVSGGLLFIGFLWAAIKFPVFLQQIVAQTGVGGAIGGVVQHVGTAAVIRRLATRG